MTSKMYIIQDFEFADGSNTFLFQPLTSCPKKSLTIISFLQKRLANQSFWCPSSSESFTSPNDMAPVIKPFEHDKSFLKLHLVLPAIIFQLSFPIEYMLILFSYIHTCMHACIHTYKHTNIHTYLPTYLPTYLHTYIPTYLHTYLPTYLRTYVPTYLRTYIPTYLHTYIPTYLPTYLRTYIPTYLPTYLPTYIHTYIIRTQIQFSKQAGNSIPRHPNNRIQRQPCFPRS